MTPVGTGLHQVTALLTATEHDFPFATVADAHRDLDISIAIVPDHVLVQLDEPLEGRSTIVSPSLRLVYRTHLLSLP
jgi:hypothetical protein